MKGNKNNYINIINNHFKQEKTINLFTNQINQIYSYKETNKNNYKVGENIIINQNYLIHGTRIDIDGLKNIKEENLIAPEFFSEINGNKKKPWVVEFWDVEKEMSLKDYMAKRCGVTIEFKNFDGSTKKNVLCAINEIERVITEEKEYRDYIIHQNQEQRFLPYKYRNNQSTMALIINCDTKQKEEIIKNDIFSKNFDREILEEILPSWFIEKYIDGAFDYHETGREKAIIVGIPSNFIEGIMVNEEIEQDYNKLVQIKEIFKNCYICNIYGKIIM